MYYTTDTPAQRKNCLVKESASLKMPCSDESLKINELVLPEDVSRKEAPPPMLDL